MGVAAEDPNERFERQREAMLREQLESRGIADKRVLEAMRRVPRHRFVPAAYADRAYDDRPLPIGEEQTISQPYMVALMTELLQLTPRSRVLEVGTGSGYQTAVIAMLARSVVSIERHAVLAQKAERALHELGLTGAIVRVGDGTLGCAEHAPYDAILVTAGGATSATVAARSVGRRLGGWSVPSARGRCNRFIFFPAEAPN